MPSFVIRLALTGRSYFRDAKKDEAEEATRRRKSSVAHCRGSQRPQRRTCESAVMGIMQNYGRAARETCGDTWGLSNRRVRLGRMSSRISREDPREGSRTGVLQPSRDVECFPGRFGVRENRDWTTIGITSPRWTRVMAKVRGHEHNSGCSCCFGH